MYACGDVDIFVYRGKHLELQQYYNYINVVNCID